MNYRDNIIQKIDNRNVIGIIIFLLIHATTALFSIPGSEKVVQAIETYENNQSLSLVEQIVTEKTVLGMKGECYLQKNENYSNIDYFSLNCYGKKYQNFILYKHELLKPLIDEKNWHLFKIDGYTFITSKIYFIITPLVDPSQNLKPEMKLFREFTYHQLAEKSILGNELFFDSSCPLEFISVNNDFYWEQNIFFKFRITCIENSNYAIIQIPADKEGKLLVGKEKVFNLTPGELFFAKMTIHSIVNEKIKWENINVYPY